MKQPQPGSGIALFVGAALSERGCCWGLSDKTQQVAKKWLPAEVCLPNIQLSKGSKGAWVCVKQAAELTPLRF